MKITDDGTTKPLFTVENTEAKLRAEIERLQAMIHPFEGAMAKVEEQGAEIERLRAVLREARQYVSDALTDEDPETQRHADALIGDIDAALEGKP